MKVMKFGGSSLADQHMIRKVGTIVTESHNDDQVAVVLSAMKGVTDQLLQMAECAAKGDHEYETLYQTLTQRITNTARELVASSEQQTCLEALEGLLEELYDILHGIFLVRECSARTLDMVAGFGERSNCLLFTYYLNSIDVSATMIDTRELIVTDDNHGGAAVFFNATYQNIQKTLTDNDCIYVITGFIGSTETGITTTLGRNGSDFTASIIGAGIKADAIEIWTDVDGVLSGDPHIVENAFVLPKISFQEAMELSYFGAKVIHPYTMIPAVESNIPIKIKNTHNPDAPGTVISSSVNKQKKSITGLASIEDVSLINIEGSGMLGVPGTASRVFTALALARVNIIMISQASSEHSICIVCRTAEAQKAVSALDAELEQELKTKKIQRFELIHDLEIIAVIGENMRGTPGISGRLFSSLGEQDINILAIAQGSSERNISFVIDRTEKGKALNTIHKAFLE